MKLEPQLIAAYLVNVIVLYIILKKVLYKPVKKFLDEREARFARRAEDIERRDHDTQEEKAKYNELMGHVQEETATMLRETRSTANRRAEDIITQSEQQAEEYIQQARKQIEDERRLARLEMRDEIVDLAVDMASRVLEREVTAEDHKRIVEGFLSSEKVG